MNRIKSSSWLIYALVTTLCWGVWGALIELPEQNGFPATMGYVVWAITMTPCALVALKISNWTLDKTPRAILLGLLVGLSGGGGQIVLFLALREGPAYIIFPVVSLYPVLTIMLSLFFLKESASKKQFLGILLALAAIFLLSYSDGETSKEGGYLWLILSGLVFIMWGVQAFAMKFSNQSMSAESIFFYMTVSALIFAPIAYFMTDLSREVNYGWNGAFAAFVIHFLNSIGALMLVYALRYGKAIIVVPLTGLSPVITIVLSLIIYGVWPTETLLLGMVIAIVAIYLFSD